MPFIDTHLHLDEDAFEPDRHEVVERALAAGVERMITIGTTALSSRLACELAACYPAVYAAVGIQPNYVHEAKAGDWDAIVDLARVPKVVAIGETGLDKYWDRAPFDLQGEYFTRHIELARTLDLPFIVHCRQAEIETVAHLQNAAGGKSLRGVMHSFTGSWEMAAACLELGMHISFAGMASFKNAQALRDVAARVPRDRLLIETDAPYLAPSPNRGKRNEPAWLPLTAAALAERCGIPLDEFARSTTENARKLFRLP